MTQFDYYKLLKEMFNEMVIKKDASLISKYYEEDFVLYTNGQTQDYAELVRFHEEVYKTEIQYAFRFEDETALNGTDGVAARLFITITKPNQTPFELELVIIAKYKDEKIHRIWELTYPDWSDIPALKEAK